jgi:hypothetical protein
MFDLVSDATAVLLPLLAGGAGGAAQGALEHSGARALDAVTGALAKRADGDASRSPGPAEVEQAVRDALADGTLTERDLRALVAQRDAINVRASKGGVAIGNIYGNVSIGHDVRRTERPDE